jgi:hypothetical protein
MNKTRRKGLSTPGGQRQPLLLIHRKASRIPKRSKMLSFVVILDRSGDMSSEFCHFSRKRYQAAIQTSDFEHNRSRLHPQPVENAASVGDADRAGASPDLFEFLGIAAQASIWPEPPAGERAANQSKSITVSALLRHSTLNFSRYVLESPCFEPVRVQAEAAAPAWLERVDVEAASVRRRCWDRRTDQCSRTRCRRPS